MSIVSIVLLCVVCVADNKEQLRTSLSATRTMDLLRLRIPSPLFRALTNVSEMAPWDWNSEFVWIPNFFLSCTMRASNSGAVPLNSSKWVPTNRTGALLALDEMSLSQYSVDERNTDQFLFIYSLSLLLINWKKPMVANAGSMKLNTNK